MSYIKRRSEGIFKILNTWSPNDLSNLDEFLVKHLNEQMINEVIENVYDIPVYNELRDRLIAMTNEYNVLKEKINSNNDELLRLQQTRRELIKETRRKKNKILKNNPDVKFTKRTITVEQPITLEESVVNYDILSVSFCILIILFAIAHSYIL